jgi:hypothetical protein
VQKQRGVITTTRDIEVPPLQLGTSNRQRFWPIITCLDSNQTEKPMIVKRPHMLLDACRFAQVHSLVVPPANSMFGTK